MCIYAFAILRKDVLLYVWAISIIYKQVDSFHLMWTFYGMSEYISQLDESKFRI